jgi:hypothetical protein
MMTHSEIRILPTALIITEYPAVVQTLLVTYLVRRKIPSFHVTSGSRHYHRHLTVTIHSISSSLLIVRLVVLTTYSF